MINTQSIQPGHESRMHPKPEFQNKEYIGTGKFRDRVVLITGGDSGIGRATAILFAKERAQVAISYLNEHEDAEQTRTIIEAEGVGCKLFPGDIGKEQFARTLVQEVKDTFGGLNILINNAAEQHPKDDLEEISQEQLVQTFETNVFSMFYLTQAALPLLQEGDSIINTTSVTAYRGSPHLLDYSATKGAIVSFTRSLATNLAPKGIRVNAVAPGPIWTPLIPSTFDEEKVRTFGQDTALGRVGQPEEVAPAYIFLASNEASYITGQVIHVNGGEIING